MKERVDYLKKVLITMTLKKDTLCYLDHNSFITKKLLWGEYLINISI